MGWSNSGTRAGFDAQLTNHRSDNAIKAAQEPIANRCDSVSPFR